MKFEPYADLVDQAFAQSNENAINNKDPHSQIEIDETPGGEYPNENYSEDTNNQNFCNSQLYVTNITRL